MLVNRRLNLVGNATYDLFDCGTIIERPEHHFSVMLGKMSGMSSGTSDTVQRCPRVSDERYPTTFPGTAYRDHRGAAGSDERTDDETLRRMLRKGVRDGLRPL